MKAQNINSEYDEQKAREYINRNLSVYADMLQSLDLGRGKILVVREDGLLLQDRISGTYIIAAENEAFQREMLDYIDEPEVIATHQDYLLDEMFHKYDFRKMLRCVTAYYPSSEKLSIECDGDIVKLDESHIEVVFDKYELMSNHDYIIERIGAGVMYGYFLEGALAGFVGMQEEGGIGFLTVFDEYKRRGIGSILESHMINVMLDMGLVPFAHIEEDNTPSLELQKKLGLHLSTDLNYWFFTEKWC